jgi:hypothetical protein
MSNELINQRWHLYFISAAWHQMARLFFLRGPFAVAFRVMSVPIDPVNSMLESWPLSHILKKVFKSFPSTANRDTAAAIIFTMRRFTAALHGNPTAICWRPIHSMFRKRGIASRKDFSEDTATTLNLIATQMYTIDNNYISAITYTEPSSVAPCGLTRERDHFKSPKNFINHWKASALFCHV